jgi:CBS domain-containing protein
MSNLITDRVEFFLKDFPPFSFLEPSELEVIAKSITVRYIKKDQTIFNEGELNTGFVYVLRQGAVRLSHMESGQPVLVDQCEVGDIFGVRSALSGKAYVMSAEAIEETLVYAVKLSEFKRLLDEHARFALFFASGYAAGQAVARGGQQGATLSIGAGEENKLEYSQGIVTCEQDQSIRNAAEVMADNNIGSIIIVNAEGMAVGILTDSDLRRKVVSKGIDLDKPVSEVMSGPVKTVASDITVTEAQMFMLQAGIHHLLVTQDGTDKSLPVGMVSDHDILLSRLNHPSALIKALKQSEDPMKWAEIRDKAEEMLLTFLDQEVSMGLVAGLISRINDMIIQKAIRQSVDKLGLHDVSFCWLSLGSEGREEQLLRTDQDNAIVFEDVDNNEEVQAKLLELAADVNNVLIECGFEKCPADIMARNPQWCQPLSVWENYFFDWVHSPDPKAVMNATIFFDLRPVYGSHAIADQLNDFLDQVIYESGTFLNFLAKNAMQNPAPLSFFKNLVVERSGEHADEFDIKARGMMPLADAARVLAFEHGIRGAYSTVDKFKALAKFEKNHAELMHEAAQAYEILMRYRAKSGLQHSDSGRYIEVEKLNKLEKQILKNAFQPVKEIQDVLEVRFKLQYFS